MQSCNTFKWSHKTDRIQSNPIFTRKSVVALNYQHTYGVVTGKRLGASAVGKALACAAPWKLLQVTFFADSPILTCAHTAQLSLAQLHPV